MFCNKKYAIGSLIDKGSNGLVYKVKQFSKTKTQGQKLVVKIQKFKKTLVNEIDALVKLMEHDKKEEKYGKEQSVALGKIAEIVDWGYMMHLPATNNHDPKDPTTNSD